MKRVTVAQVAIGVVSMVLVYTVACQFSSVKLNLAVDLPEKARIEDLQNQLTAEKEKSEDVSAQLFEAQQSLEKYRHEATNNDEVNAAMKEEFDKARLLAGTIAAEGKGVLVTLSDSSIPQKDITSGNNEQYIVHDTDLRMVTTELAGAGAEVISVNGQRLVSTSAIRCVGNTIMVNDVKVAPPFEIRAIGDPATLEAALLIKGGAADYLKSWNMELSVKKMDKVSIGRYTGALNFKFAVPAADEGDSGR